MRHALGVLGVLAAGVLLAVSAAMNWQFGYSLGRTELDGQIYGTASVAADCFKALVPFFFFAAIRNRMWSQAAAAAVLWVVVTAYSLTSALGHAFLNRLDTAGQRTHAATAYADLRGDLKRAEEQLSWVPKHRPAAMVQSEIEGLKGQKAWGWTKGCTDINGKFNRDFCQQYHGLSAEFGAAQQALTHEKRISEIKAQIASANTRGVHSEADPQAAILAKVSGLELEKVQTAMAIFVALLLEIGSGFGMYVAFSQWRINDRHVPAAPRMVAEPVVTAAVAVAAPAIAPPAVVQKPRSGVANDNKSAPAQRQLAPENDVERFYKEKIEIQDGSSLTATSLYEDYCAWCEAKNKEPLALPTFGREFGELGVKKERIAGRVRYIGIALRSGGDIEEVKKPPVFNTQAA